MRSRARAELRIAALAAIALACFLTLRGSVRTTPGAVGLPAPATVVGQSTAPVSLGRLMIVVLRVPSVAERLRPGLPPTEQQERSWSAEAFAAQQQVLTELAAHGLATRPAYSFTRVLDGFSALLDPRAVTLLERDPEIAGVYPVRVAYPATLPGGAPPAGAAGPGSGLALPGFDGTGVSIALLDTGVAGSTPYLGGRVEPGIDIVGGAAGAVAGRDPVSPHQLELHGTELAGLLVGSGGPGGLHGVAPGAIVLPIRVAGCQPATRSTRAATS